MPPEQLIWALVVAVVPVVVGVYLKRYLKTKDRRVREHSRRTDSDELAAERSSQVPLALPEEERARAQPPLPTPPTAIGSTTSSMDMSAPRTLPPSQRFLPEAVGLDTPRLDTRPIDLADYAGRSGSEIDAQFISELDWATDEGGTWTVYGRDL